MPNTLRVIAAPGLTVPCHDGKAQITAHRAMEVPDCAYYRRRMADGDLASAVATQEATDEDSNGLAQQAAKDATVAIRKQAEPANGYRFQAAQAPAPAPQAPEE